MSNLIQATPDELRGNGAQFIRYSGEVQDIVKNTDALSSQMAEMWKGSSSDAFMSQYQELKPTMLKFIDLINDIGEQVNSVSTALEQADNDIAAQIGK